MLVVKRTQKNLSSLPHRVQNSPVVDKLYNYKRKSQIFHDLMDENKWA